MDPKKDLEHQPPPHSIEAERSVLGSILLKSDSLNQVRDMLTKDDFYLERHGKIYSMMCLLYDKHQEVDIVSLCDLLAKNNQLEEVGNADYITGLYTSIPTSANIRQHAQIVKEKSHIRQLIDMTIKLKAISMSENKELHELLSLAQEYITNLTEASMKGDIEVLGDILNITCEQLSEVFRDPEAHTGLMTHFPNLDKITGGLRGGNLIIIAGRPSTGKTTFAMNIAYNIALYSRLPVGIFSLEMAKKEIAFKFLSREAQVDSLKIQRGELTDKEWNKIIEAADTLKSMRVYIDDTSAIPLSEIRAKAKRMTETMGVKLIIIDYLQLIGSPPRWDTGYRLENRQEVIAEFSRGLKALAKDLAIPIIALSQLNREIEKRTDPTPKLSDLRESGAIEQDADLIAFLYSRNTKKKEEKETTNPKEEPIIMVDIKKHRNGPTGKVAMVFNKAFSLVGEPADDMIENFDKATAEQLDTSVDDN